MWELLDPVVIHMRKKSAYIQTKTPTNSGMVVNNNIFIEHSDIYTEKYIILISTALDRK